MSLEPPEKRLFVPLNTEPYRYFESGLKDTELRGLNHQFNPETVVPGRRVELRRGYSTDDSLWGTIEHVHNFRHITNIAGIIDHERISPGLDRDEFEEHIADMLGDYSQWIAFKIRLDNFNES